MERAVYMSKSRCNITDVKNIIKVCQRMIKERRDVKTEYLLTQRVNNVK